MTERLDLRNALRNEGFSGALIAECPLAPHTTWRIGGPAELLAVPESRDDLVLAVRWAAGRGIPWRVLGNGSNLLVRDIGVRGLVLRMRKVLDDLDCHAGVLAAGAGASFPAAARVAAAAGLAGIEFGGGIPGTVGGAIVMNAGWHEHEIGAHVIDVDYLDAAGRIRTYTADACRFGYRTSRFRGDGGVVLSTRLDLRPDDPAAVRARMEKYAASRKANQPTELPSCGSVFLKPPGDFAGRLIEEAGLKGARVGGVQVSPKHANFFINDDNATAADVLELVVRVESEVERQFGVRLEREFELW